MVLVANTVVFGADAVVIRSKDSDILETKCLFVNIHLYYGGITAVFGETQWQLWEIQWNLI